MLPKKEVILPKIKVLTVKIRGVADDELAQEMTRIFLDSMRLGHIHAILDLSEADGLTHEVVAVLEAKAHQLGRYRGGLYVVGAPKEVEALIHFHQPRTSQTRILFFPKEEQAVEYIENAA